LYRLTIAETREPSDVCTKNGPGKSVELPENTFTENFGFVRAGWYCRHPRGTTAEVGFRTRYRPSGDKLWIRHRRQYYRRVSAMLAIEKKYEKPRFSTKSTVPQREECAFFVCGGTNLAW
jgi:hypothetical protein